MEVTDKGIAMLETYVAAVRDAVGMEIPLSTDHLGHLGVKSIIRLGKAYNVPVYQMLGGKFRDKIRIYADTTESKDPKVYAQRLKERKEVMGLTWLKMDLGIEMVADNPGTVTNPTTCNSGRRTSFHILCWVWR